MAIFYLHASVVSRATNRSSVAAAAYRSGTMLTNERDGRTHDYRNRTKGDEPILWQGICIPKDAPEWMADRSKLWNAVEKLEKRKDAQTARELVGALPHELSLSENIAVAKEFAETLTADGMVADLAIHPPHKKNKQTGDTNKNIHLHCMLTTRNIECGKFAAKNREWNSKKYLTELKQRWELICNKHLERAKCQARIDRTSPMERDLPYLPQIHMGVAAWHMEQRGIRTHKGNYNRAIVRYNQQLKDCYQQLQDNYDAYKKAKAELGRITDAESKLAQLTAQLNRINMRLHSLNRRRAVLAGAVTDGRLSPSQRPTGVLARVTGKQSRWARMRSRALGALDKIDHEQTRLTMRDGTQERLMQRQGDAQRDLMALQQPQSEHMPRGASVSIGRGRDDDDKAQTANRALMSESAREREQNEKFWRGI